MIKCDKGKVAIAGTGADVLVEFSLIAASTRECLRQALGDDARADAVLATALRAGIKVSDEENAND